MGKFRWAAVAISAALAVTGCSAFDDSENDASAASQPQAAPKVPVDMIENLELGRLHNGYMLTAFGFAPGGGYYEPELRIRYDGRPTVDGFYEFDFLIRAPDDLSLFANSPMPARRVRGDYALPVDMLRGAVGVRIWSARDSVEGRF